MRPPAIDRSGRARLVEDMLSYMTLEEKLGQLRVVRLDQDSRASDGTISENILALLRSGAVAAIEGVASREEALELQTVAVEQSRFGIPLLFSSKGAPAAERLWPQPLAMAASWDAEAVARVARDVATAAIDKGWNLVATPAINLLSDATPDAGTSLGMASHLAERIACGLIEGLQGDSPSSPENVLGLFCYGPLPVAGPERRAAERLVRAILRRGDLAAIEELPASTAKSGPKADSASHSAFAGIDLGAWRELARLGAAQPHETDRRELASGMDEGYLSQNMIDDAVRRVLGAKSDLGLFREPYHKLHGAAEPSPGAPFVGPAASEDLARKSIVLLRNEDDLLPLPRDSGRVLVVGTRAEHTAGLREALNASGFEHSAVSGLALRPDDGADQVEPLRADGIAIGMACDAASRSATVLVTITDADCEPPSGRPMRKLGSAGEALLRGLLNANRQLVLIEATRLPLDLGSLALRVPARLLAWTEHRDGANALSAVLTGRVNPSGRLPLALTGDDPTTSLPFGHGLGYSRVAYSDVEVEFGAECVIARASLRNCGEHDCIETVLLCLRSPAWDDGAEPQLRCFQRVALAAGESQRVQFELGLEELGEIAADGRITLEPGRYEILLGKDAAHLSGCEIDVSGAMIRAVSGFSRRARAHPGRS